MKSIAVVTSKKATEHLEKVRQEHADWVKKIQEQALNVAQHKMAKAAEQKEAQFQAQESAHRAEEMRLKHIQATKPHSNG